MRGVKKSFKDTDKKIVGSSVMWDFHPLKTIPSLLPKSWDLGTGSEPLTHYFNPVHVASVDVDRPTPTTACLFHPAFWLSGHSTKVATAFQFSVLLSMWSRMLFGVGIRFISSHAPFLSTLQRLQLKNVCSASSKLCEVVISLTMLPLIPRFNVWNQAGHPSSRNSMQPPILPLFKRCPL